MESSIRSLYRELNAFEKSSFIRIESSAISPRKRVAACTAASHPPGTPTPTCRGDRYSTTLGTAKSLAHFADNLRQKYPITIIGCRPPRLLFRQKVMRELGQGRFRPRANLSGMLLLRAARGQIVRM